MNIVVISGSTRPDSQSRRVADYLVKKLNSFDVKAGLVDLYEQQLPLYDDTDDGPWKAAWEPIKQALADADGFVFVSPEWDGMFSVGLHNMFHYAINHGNVLSHKPVMLVGVSDGRGAAYPLAQMKMTGPKNAHYVVMPENLRIQEVKKIFVDGEFTVEGVRQRAEYSLKMLLEYAKAFKTVRNSGLIDLKNFGSGV